MSAPPYESRPNPWAEAAKSFGGDLPMVPGTGTLDLVRLSPRDRYLWDQAHAHGYVSGHEAGVLWADERAAALHREAVRVVRFMAGLPELDADECRRRRLERESRWGM